MDRGQWDLRKACKAEVMSLSALLQCVAAAAAPHTFLYYTTHHSTYSPLLLFSLFLCLSHGCPFALNHLFGLLLAEREVPLPLLLCPRDLDICFVYMEAIFLFCFFRRRRLRLHFAPFRPRDASHARGNCCPRFSINLPELSQQLYNTLHYIKKKKQIK